MKRLILVALLALSLPGAALAQFMSTPHPGTEASLRRYIESLEKGAPNYDEMLPPMADAVRQQLPQILALIKPWGALKSITFTGNTPDGGADIFEVIFENGKAQWLMGALTAEGKVGARGFRAL